MAELLGSVSEFEKLRKKKGISIYSFKNRAFPALHAAGKGLAALIGLPYFIFSGIANLPMWIAAELIRRKIRDKAFRNTVSLGVKLGMMTILLPLYAILSFCLAPWWAALMFHWGDTYVLEYQNPADEIPGLLLVIAIDAVNCSKNK